MEHPWGLCHHYVVPDLDGCVLRDCSLSQATTILSFLGVSLHNGSSQLGWLTVYSPSPIRDQRDKDSHLSIGGLTPAVCSSVLIALGLGKGLEYIKVGKDGALSFQGHPQPAG